MEPVQLPRRDASGRNLAHSSDRKSSPFLAKRSFEFDSNSVLINDAPAIVNIPGSFSVAKSVSRGVALPDQINLSRHALRRSADAPYPSMSHDTNTPHTPIKTPPRTPVTPILSSMFPTFRRPHSNPNLSRNRQNCTASTDDVVAAKKSEMLEADTELRRINQSAPNVKRTTTSIPVVIPGHNFGIHSFSDLKTSTPNDQKRSLSQGAPTPINLQSTIRPDVLECTMSDQKSADSICVKPSKRPVLSESYLQSIRDMLAEKPAYLSAESRINSENNLKYVSNPEVTNQIRAHHSEGAAATQRHNSKLNLNGKSTSVTALMSVLEDLKRRKSEKTLETKPLKLSQTAPTGLNAKSTPFFVNATSEQGSKDTTTSQNTTVVHGPRRVSSVDLQSEDSFQILSDQVTDFSVSKPTRPTLPATREQVNSPSESFLQFNNRHQSETSLPPNHMSASSSASFIKLNSEMFLESLNGAPPGKLDKPEAIPTDLETKTVDESKNKYCELVNNEHTKQSHALAVTANKYDATLTPLFASQSIFSEYSTPYPRFGLSDFITPTTPSAFITDLDSQESLLSLEPRTIDCDNTLVAKCSKNIAPTNFPVEKVPSHYKIELLHSDSDSETFLPLTPSDVQTQPDTPPPQQLAETAEKELEIVSLPQSSVASPSKQFTDTPPVKTGRGENSVENAPKILSNSAYDETRQGTNHESSSEYLNRFVEEVRHFMERRNGEIPQNISKEIQVTLIDNATDPIIPPNIDQLITELAREKFDSLWEGYIQNKVALPRGPFLTRRNTKMPHGGTCDSTFSGYNSRATSSFSDTTLFIPKNIPEKFSRNKLQLVMKPRRRQTRKSRRESAKNIFATPSPANHLELDTVQVPDKNILSVKRNSVAFLVSSNETEGEKCVYHSESLRASADMSHMTLQEACQSLNPRFVTNSHLRQVQVQKLRLWREEMSRHINQKPTANKSIQTLHNGNSQLRGSFIPYRRKLGPDEIQRQNQRWRKKFSFQKRRDEGKIQRQRGQQMRIRVRTYQREILDPVRKSLSRHS